jgi:hypothetical protein
MPRVQIIHEDYSVRPEISYDGRSIIIPGKRQFYVINPLTMDIMSQIHVADSHYCKMTDTHVFLKHSKTHDLDWTVASLKETELLTIYQGKKSVVTQEKDLQYIIANESQKN